MRLKLVICSAILIVGAFSFALFTNSVYAAEFRINSGDITGRNGIDPGEKDSSVIANILNGVYQIAAIIAVLMLVISGIRYITSDGDPGRTQSARKGIIYALVGLAIIGSAFIITGVIQGLFV